MPAASTKTEKLVSIEANDPLKQVLAIMDKKVRNLEKRKGKLDTLKEKVEKGQTLEKDQQVAVDRYSEVMANLEMSRELQKQFQSFSCDAEKMLKKQGKRDKAERNMLEMKRMRGMLQLQNMLDSLGSDRVRSDFKSGKHGAVVLTDENLSQLDELYKLISPSRDGESDYLEELNKASEHIVSLLDGKDREVVGTTYKELKELIDLIIGCGYFETAPQNEEEESSLEAAPEQDSHVTSTDPSQPEPVGMVQSSLPAEMHVLDEQIDNDNDRNCDENCPDVSQPLQPDMNSAAEADSFFSTDAPAIAAAYRQRPFQEIVSSVQGNFNFLQDSEIDMESPHMDPAVVAAHPMPSAQRQSSQGPDMGNLPQNTFSSQRFVSEQQNQLDSENCQQPNEHSHQSLLGQQSVTGHVSKDFASATFGHTQSITNDSMFPSSVEDDPSSQMTNSSLSATNDTTISQFEMPPSIPMPPNQENQQSQSLSEKKMLNPNAGVFQSQIYPSPHSQDDSQAQSSQSDSSQSGYQGNSYNNGQFQRSNSGGRGGFRGDRRGGSRGGGGGMSNGFNNRGRGEGRGGSYGNSRGGYPSYQPRTTEYRQEGLQGGTYNNSNSFGSSGYQKRGAPRGGSAGVRGGAPRGGNGPRGTRGFGGPASSGGGFGRPNFGQQT